MQNIRRLIPFVVIVVMLASLTACGTASPSPNTGTLASPQPTAPPTSVATPTPTPQGHFKVGDAVNIGNIWMMTIISAKSGGTADYLKPGQVFLNIVAMAKNISTQEQTISSFDFTLRDPSGETQNVAYDPNAPATDLSGKVEPGSPIKGGLTFAVLSTTHHFQLFFEVSVITSGQTIWDIDV